MPMSSLNATRTRNALSPSCASGRPSKLAVSACSCVWVSGPGPLTMCAAPIDRALPSAVQTASSASQSDAGARAIDSSISLIEDQEFDRFSVRGLGNAVENRHMEWWYLPIPDGSPPGSVFETAWGDAGGAIVTDYDRASTC